MKIQDAIDQIETCLYEGKSRSTESNTEVISRLTTAKGILVAIKKSSSEQGDLLVPKDLADLLSEKSSIALRQAEAIDHAASQWRADRDKGYGEKHGENHNGSRSSVFKRFCQLDFWLPCLVSIIFLALGLTLGCTVFAEKQDALYFGLESIKDIIGGIASWLCVKGFVDGRPKNGIDIKHDEGRWDGVVKGFLFVFEILALLFSIFLWLGAMLAVFERFSHWRKFTYFWMSISVAFISAICTVTLVMRLFKSRKDDKWRDDA